MYLSQLERFDCLDITSVGGKVVCVAGLNIFMTLCQLNCIPLDAHRIVQITHGKNFIHYFRWISLSGNQLVLLLYHHPQ